MASCRFGTAAVEYEIANRPEIITVEFCWNGYRETLKGRPAHITMGYEALAVLPRLGRYAASDITEEHCRDYHAHRLRENRKDGTTWTELGRLRSALKWAERENLIIKAPAI